MGFWRGFYLLSLLNAARCLPESSYSVHLNRLSFIDAEDYCKPGSFLTNILNENERKRILQTILDNSNKTATSFWIGLNKGKGVCTQTHLPLKGFLWTVDNSSQSDIKIWETDPPSTCTETQCGLLQVEYGESGIKSSKIVAVACKQTYPFICKRNVTMMCPPPQLDTTFDIVKHMHDPYFSQINCPSGDVYNLTCSKDLTWKLIGNENMRLSLLCRKCNNGYRKDTSGNCVDVNECEANPCKHRCLNTEGSYKCLCDKGDCDKPNTSTIHPKRAEFLETVPSHPTSLPSDVTTNKSEVHIEEKAGDISNIIVPVIIALLIFIVLLVIVAAIVKACLRRRTIKRARRKAEAVALNGSSSMEKVNEKEET